MFKLSSPDAVIDELVKHRRNNGQNFSRASIEEEVWKYWCSRDPVRCGGSEATRPVPFLPRDQKPEFFGPIIWPFLNLAATRFDHIGPDRFFQIVASVVNLMSCPDCQRHWLEVISDNPPEVRDAKSACQWVYLVHSLVSHHLGKPAYTYAQGVVDYGFPLP